MKLASALPGALAAACIFVAGCTPERELGRGALDSAALAALDAWEWRGRVAVNAEGRGAQARVLWRQQGAKARLELSGPWGMGTRRVVIDGADALLWSEGLWAPLCASGSGDDELALLCDSAPLTSLPFWLRGLPDPASAYTESPYPQGVREFRQDGWLIEVNALDRVGGLTVPRRVVVSGPGATLKVAITRWSLPEVHP